MKANELMIGDWITKESPSGNKVQIKVSVNDIVCMCERMISDSCKWSPIPITEEILKANGFSEFKCTTSRRFRWTTGGVPEYYDVSVVVGMENDAERWDCLMFEIQYYRGAGKMYHMQYVHELQHILHSIGLNELANNFKV